MTVIAEADLMASLKVGLLDNNNEVHQCAEDVLVALSRGAPRAVITDADLMMAQQLFSIVELVPFFTAQLCLETSRRVLECFYRSRFWFC